ncbi:hypothetical protein AAHZ94_25580, partial [Streptomyces sp. HSW2009]
GARPGGGRGRGGARGGGGRPRGGSGGGAGGLAALGAMLATCAPGLTVVNIDNGFGAAVHAAKVVRAVHGA